MWVIVSCQDYMYILCMPTLYIYSHPEGGRMWKCDTMLDKMGRSCCKVHSLFTQGLQQKMYIRTVYTIYVWCMYIPILDIYMYIYRASANQETNCWSLSKIGHMIGRSFTDQVHVSMIHYRGLGRIGFLQNNILRLLVNIPFGWDVDIY